MYSCLEGRIEIAAWILEEICPDLEGCKCDLCIIERYPLRMDRRGENTFIILKSILSRR